MLVLEVIPLQMQESTFPFVELDGFTLPISPGSQCLSECEHDPLVYQPLLSLKFYLVPSSGLLMKKFNSMVPDTSVTGTPEARH